MTRKIKENGPTPAHTVENWTVLRDFGCGTLNSSAMFGFSDTGGVGCFPTESVGSFEPVESTGAVSCCVAMSRLETDCVKVLAAPVSSF